MSRDRGLRVNALAPARWRRSVRGGPGPLEAVPGFIEPSSTPAQLDRGSHTAGASARGPLRPARPPPHDRPMPERPRESARARRLERWGAEARLGTPGRPSETARRVIRTLVRPIVRTLYRPTLDGLENLPDGPFLLVANHSGGIALAEIFSFAALYLERCPDRPLAGFAHPAGFRIWPTTRIMPALGAVPSTRAAALATLAAGVPLLVFPGGDHEALRPLWQAHTVDFGGRTGFLRLAAEAGVPVVPMGIRGSHFTVPILWRSRRLLAYALVTPRLIGVERFAVTLLGALGAAALLLGPDWPLPWRALAAWAWLPSPFVFLPWVPWKIRMRIGAPLRVGADPRRELARVEAAVQALVR
jgi:1-acyl-sn-glycerol-3-phosphate acyltransferase